VERVIPFVVEKLNLALGDFSSEEATELSRLLVKLNTRLETMVDSKADCDLMATPSWPASRRIATEHAFRWVPSKRRRENSGGRYVSPDEAPIEREFYLVHQEWQFPSSFNVAPTQQVPILRERGQIPFFAPGEAPKYSTINARIELATGSGTWTGRGARYRATFTSTTNRC
jgi:hypothetical protein